jgi:hypothetical protein
MVTPAPYPDPILIIPLPLRQLEQHRPHLRHPRPLHLLLHCSYCDYRCIPLPSLYPPTPWDHVGSASVLRSRGSAARSRSVPRTKHRSRCNSPGSVAQSSRVAQRSGVGDRGGGAPGIARTAANRPPPTHTPMQAHFFSLHYLRQLLFMRLRQHVRTMEQRDGRWERKRGWAESAWATVLRGFCVQFFVCATQLRRIQHRSYLR